MTELNSLSSRTFSDNYSKIIYNKYSIRMKKLLWNSQMIIKWIIHFCSKLASRIPKIKDQKPAREALYLTNFIIELSTDVGIYWGSLRVGLHWEMRNNYKIVELRKGKKRRTIFRRILMKFKVSYKAESKKKGSIG
jgi:hypothetical protein